MKEQIFISYKRVDKERVFAIKDFIEQNTGAKCWIDLEGIKSDAQFASIIISAIREAEIFLFMYSNAHGNINLDNDWTIRELNFAEKRGKRIVFINIDQSPLTDWFELMFGTKQQIDATNSDMLNRLCDDLCSWLGILKPAIKSEGKSPKTAKRDALPEPAIKSEGKTPKKAKRDVLPKPTIKSEGKSPKTANRDALPKEPFRVGNLTCKASEHGGVSVCGCDKSLKEVHIPAKVEYGGYTYDVDSIGNNAFWFCKSLTSITIPDSVTSIGEFAFYDCESLTSITIPNGLTSIGNSAFACCKSLTSITIPNSVTSIGDYAFRECSVLTSITIPNSVINIGEYAFFRCESLTSITIPNSVTSIGRFAFKWCSGLSSISIPDSVTSIGDSAFLECKSLTSITIPDSVTSIGESAFIGCSSLREISIPKQLTSIGKDAIPEHTRVRKRGNWSLW